MGKKASTKSGNPRTLNLPIRMDVDEYEMIISAAGEVPVSTWARELMLKTAAKVLRDRSKKTEG